MISSRSLVFPGAWIRKEVVRNFRWQTRWILESNGMSSRESSSTLRNSESIRNTMFFVSSFSPIHVIVHWHEDDPSFELQWDAEGNDIAWDAKGNDELCVNNSKTIKEYARRFPRGHWSSLGPGSEKKWYGTFDGKPDGSWNRTAEKMLQNFKDSGHPIFRCTSPLERGEFRSKAGGKTTIHFNGSTENTELLLQMVISVNQLSLCWAVADMIAELPVDQRAPGKPVASGRLDEQEIITEPPLAELQANEERQGNLLQEYEERIEKLSEDQKLSRLCSEAGLRSVEVGQFFYALPSPRGEANQSSCR